MAPKLSSCNYAFDAKLTYLVQATEVAGEKNCRNVIWSLDATTMVKEGTQMSDLGGWFPIYDMQ